MDANIISDATPAHLQANIISDATPAHLQARQTQGDSPAASSRKTTAAIKYGHSYSAIEQSLAMPARLLAPARVLCAYDPSLDPPTAPSVAR